ncbi:MAG: hypothetical protein JWR01_780 [Subtercola sp.]|nr:hypothetical protein [Subtercola sp.]
MTRVDGDGSVTVDPFGLANGIAQVQQQQLRGLRVRSDELDRLDSEKISADLKLLERVPDLRDFSISPNLPTRRLKNYLGIRALSRLESLGIHNYPELDLDWFPNLLTLSLTDRKTVRNLERRTTLNSIRMWRLSHADLSRWAGLDQLETLWLSQAGVAELRGIKSLTSLRKLEVHNSRKLSQIGRLPDLLTSLSVGACPKIRDLDFSLIGPTLEDFYIDFPLSLDFVAKMPRLMRFAFQSVTSNDLTPLLDSGSLERVFFTNKKRYSHSAEEINAILAQR